MADKKFNSKQEINEYIKNNSTSFEEFEKRLDYSLFEKHNQKVNKTRKFSFKKLGYALVSLFVVVIICLVIHKAYENIHKITKCPYELGTYTYYSQEGNIEGLDFDEDSYIIMTDQELSGPGTFKIENKDWVVYGQFYECEFEKAKMTQENGQYYFDNYECFVEVSTTNNKSYFSMKIKYVNLSHSIYFVNES